MDNARLEIATLILPGLTSGTVGAVFIDMLIDIDMEATCSSRMALEIEIMETAIKARK